MDKLQVGDRVQFDLEGCTRPTPHGYGIVTRVEKGSILVKPDGPLAGRTKMLNIVKAVPKTK